MKLHADQAERWVAEMALLDAADPLAGAAVLGEPSFYWERSQTQEAVAGWGELSVLQAHDAAEAIHILGMLGSSMELRWIGQSPEWIPGPWFGGMRFDLTSPSSEPWKAHGVARWTLPELLVWRVGKQLAVMVLAPWRGGGEEAGVSARLKQVCDSFPTRYYHPRSEPVSLELSASREDFEARVGGALEEIASGRLRKVVMARAVEAEGSRPFNRVDVVARLREQNPRCVTFMFHAPGGVAFLGATPETLCRVDRRTLETEALAGSAAPTLAEGLGGSDKDRREHEAVVDYILSALRPLAVRVSADSSPSLLPLKNVVHLRTGIRAELRNSVSPAHVVQALHPTPAVGGVPREAALGFLRQAEALDRGWYAGPVGWVGPAGAHMAVALRSALVRGSHARLFVGAGIVQGSSPESEWRETEIKSLAMLQALSGSSAKR
ncbi:isochorismate synthase [Hyalangium versicolor]|uniref:isochorismate synthase n=1 Tax=Hyalangium versicolor TaxID=2861190 RepID=UPI001CCD84ED|nr:isochorismate synthase [Hyalangium versicolor]